MRHPRGLSHRPDLDQRFPAGTPAPLPALRRWKVLQFCFTLLAVNNLLLLLCPVPKTTASLANLSIARAFP